MPPTRRTRRFRLGIAATLCAVTAIGAVPNHARAAGERDGDDVLVRLGDWWHYFKGVREPSPEPGSGRATTAWTEIGFDDVEWLVGPSGIGYGDGEPRTPLPDMEGQYLSVYARRRFDAGKRRPIETIQRLGLRIDWDDGFVAYLNGTEIARAGLSGSPPRFIDTASEHESGMPEVFLVDPRLLVAGDNVLAIQVHNAALASSDLVLSPELLVDPDVCPTPNSFTCRFDLGAGAVGISWNPSPAWSFLRIRREGELLSERWPASSSTFCDREPPIGRDVEYSIEVVTETPRGFETCCPEVEKIEYTVPRADVLVQEGALWSFRRGNRSPPPNWIDTEFDDRDWERGPTAIGYGDGDDRTRLVDMQEIAGVQPGYLVVFCRRAVEIDDPASATWHVRVRYDDGFVLWVNGEELCRKNVANWVEIDATTRALGPASEPSEVDFEIPASVLRPGRNVLAASVHNVAVSSSDLTFLPWFWRRPLADAPPDPQASRFLRGDANSDGSINLSDAIGVLAYLFRAGSPPACFDAADADDSGSITISDAILVLRWLFLGDPLFPDPNDGCAEDTDAEDALPACDAAAC